MITITRTKPVILQFIALTAVLHMFSACTPTIVASGAATAGVTAVQERSVGGAVDDATIRLKLNHLFLQKDVNDLFKNVGTAVIEGRVLLTGNVERPETAIEAVRLAWQVHGVREVINEIQVNNKSGFTDYARDLWIAAQIKGTMFFTKGIMSINYNVESVNGVVYLIGIAQSEEELRKVTHIARTTKYVKQVISHVIMKNDPRRK